MAMSNFAPTNTKSLGWFFIGFVALAGVLILPGATESASPTLYVIIFGGLFVGVFAVLGVGLVTGRVRLK
jgi:hypothetical protein